MLCGAGVSWVVTLAVMPSVSWRSWAKVVAKSWSVGGMRVEPLVSRALA